MSGLTQRYISKELVHFVGRGMNEDQQFELLLKILNECWITHAPHNPNISGNLTVNPNAAISENEMYAPQITCFTDIPIQDLSMHMQKYSPVGISFSKDFIAEAGGVPVHYIPKGAKVQRPQKIDAYDYMKLMKEEKGETFIENIYENISKAQYFDEMLKEYHLLFNIFREQSKIIDPQPGVSGLFKRVLDLERFLSFHIYSYFKFFDHTLPDDNPDNYYFEREWRVVGNVKIDLADVKTVFSPPKYAERFRNECPQFFGQVIFAD
ncbi:MAG: abortive infection system antitoxin AbiGi family protein [Smithella sp.]|jgi:hypothetical protein